MSGSSTRPDSSMEISSPERGDSAVQHTYNMPPTPEKQQLCSSPSGYLQASTPGVCPHSLEEKPSRAKAHTPATKFPAGRVAHWFRGYSHATTRAATAPAPVRDAGDGPGTILLCNGERWGLGVSGVLPHRDTRAWASGRA